jgi:hypothetical protein
MKLLILIILVFNLAFAFKLNDERIKELEAKLNEANQKIEKLTKMLNCISQ